jgi:hypothetical protein
MGPQTRSSPPPLPPAPLALGSLLPELLSTPSRPLGPLQPAAAAVPGALRPFVPSQLSRDPPIRRSDTVDHF